MHRQWSGFCLQNRNWPWWSRRKCSWYYNENVKKYIDDLFSNDITQPKQIIRKLQTKNFELSSYVPITSSLDHYKKKLWFIYCKVTQVITMMTTLDILLFHLNLYNMMRKMEMGKILTKINFVYFYHLYASWTLHLCWCNIYIRKWYI